MKKRPEFESALWGSSALLSRRFCSHEARALFALDELSVWAADYNGVLSAPRTAVVLNCSCTPRPRIKLGRFQEALTPHVQMWEEIALDWPDGGLPLVLPSFWVALPKALNDAGVTDMVVHCLGGHGRTGTALAALLIVRGMEAKAAMAWVRKNYCERAIETMLQERYLYKL